MPPRHLQMTSLRNDSSSIGEAELAGEDPDVPAIRVATTVACFVACPQLQYTSPFNTVCTIWSCDWCQDGKKSQFTCFYKFPFTHSLARFIQDASCTLMVLLFLLLLWFAETLASSHWKSLYAEHCVTTLDKSQPGTSLQLCQTLFDHVWP